MIKLIHIERQLFKWLCNISLVVFAHSIFQIKTYAVFNLVAFKELYHCTGMGINEAEYIFRRQTIYHHCCVACPCGISEQQLIGRSFHRNHREAHCCQDLSYLRLGWDGPALCAGSPTEDIIQKKYLQYKCQKGWVRFMFCWRRWH